MNIQIIGESPLQETVPARFNKGIGTIFPACKALVTLPGIHATQRLAMTEYLNEERAQTGKPSLSVAEAEQVWANAVDLFFEPDCIQIRPWPDNMDLTFEADEALQTLVSKTDIKFLHATNQKVLQAIRARGECWRICALPRSPEEIKRLIAEAKCAIAGEAIYYHNRFTGTRFLTCEAFRQLGGLPPEMLAKQLQEIREFSPRINRQQQPEITFFQATIFGARNFAGFDFDRLDVTDLCAAHEALKAGFGAAVPAEMRHDDVENPTWRRAMFAALIGEQDETMSDAILDGLSPEYLHQPLWLPGCRIEKGEVICDSIFAELEQYPGREDLAELCDPRANSFIFNFIREYGELEYVNIAALPRSLARRLPAEGRRGVYLAELKPRHSPAPKVCILRMQKWDAAGHLDHVKDLLGAMLEAAEYTEYVLDRRLACRQLGMNLPSRIMMHRLGEPYTGRDERYRGQLIWLTYFERDYFTGLASDKIAQGKLEDEAYTLKFAQLLGKAAAPNLIVGRLDIHNQVLFDDGDELVREENGVPVEILVADPTGAFGDFTQPLDHYAEAYARPVNRRWPWLKNPPVFAEAYLVAMNHEFHRIQAEYRKRRKAFDLLFHHRIRDPHGNFPFRWEKVLERLDRADPDALTASIRENIGPG